MRTSACLSLMATLCSLAAGQTMPSLRLPPWDEVRDKAFRVEMEPILRTPLTVVLTYDPSGHPESRIVIRVRDRAHVDVELIRGTLSLREALSRLDSQSPTDEETVLSLMGVKRTRGTLDAKLAMGWIKQIRTAILHDLIEVEGGRLPDMLQSDGTVYQVYYRGWKEFSADVPGCEVPCDGKGDSPLVRWMNVIWKQVNSMQLTPEAAPSIEGAKPAAPANHSEDPTVE